MANTASYPRNDPAALAPGKVNAIDLGRGQQVYL
jgi:hypothetical protein